MYSHIYMYTYMYVLFKKKIGHRPKVTLSICLSEFLLTNLFSVLFLDQPQLPKRRTVAQSSWK